jgi:hypothetical protein
MIGWFVLDFETALIFNYFDVPLEDTEQGGQNNIIGTSRDVIHMSQKKGNTLLQNKESFLS